MKKRTTIKCLTWMVVLLLSFGIGMAVSNQEVAAKAKTYTVTTKTKPCSKKYKNSSGSAKHYSMLQSYLEKLKKTGGTLVLKKGTYTVNGTLFVPSNVTVKLSNGVIVKKTGTSPNVLFAITPDGNKAYTKYNASKKASIIGEGKAIIDLNKTASTTAICVSHSSNVKVSGITFKNAYKGSYIRVLSSKKVTIEKNKFEACKKTSSGNSIGVFLIVPDSVVNNAYYKWCKNDKTENTDITISNNTFIKLNRAIASTTLVKGKYQKNVKVTNNKINNMYTDGIRMVNWKNAVVKNNTITNVAKGGRGIYASGIVNPTITENTFDKMDRAIQIALYTPTGSAKKYGTSKSSISAANKKALLNNTLKDVEEYYIRVNDKGVSSEDWEIIDYSDNNFAITPSSGTYKNKYLHYTSYTKITKTSYMIQSYLEQLANVGGGTLTFKKGTYDISKAIDIPSNVTIIFEDGVVIEKSTKHKDTQSMFLFVDPTVDASGGVYSGYNGIHDTKIIGKGNVVFNMNSFHKSFAFVLGHTKNISISGITFKNMNEGHFIELDASNNVTISNCTFMNNASTSEKAAINIDIPDAKIGGFSFNFSTQDKTPNKNITIQNCTFKNLFRAIDSHMFSKGKYHENVTIKNCNISHCAVSPILMENWKNPVVIDNVIDDVYKGDGGALAVSDRYGVYMRGGVINPTIKNNTFKNLGQTIFAKSWENAQIPEYGITVNKIYPANIADMKNNTLVNVTNDFFAINTSATDTRGQRGEEHYYDAEKITK